MYKVINPFKDLEENHLYKTGDKFPFNNKEILDERIASLLSNKNKVGKPLIEEVEEDKEKTPKRLQKLKRNSEVV